MANIVFNIAKGRVSELYNRVKNADPANCALVLVPIATAGLEADSVLADKATLADVLSGATDEQTTMGRKVLVSADLAAIPAPDNANDRNERSLPNVTWTGAAGSAIAKLLVAFRNAPGDADSAIVPLTLFDAAVTPDGGNLVLTGGTFHRAQ